MEISQIKLVYFSATGTTQKVLESIAAGMKGKKIEHINLTIPSEAMKMIQPFSDEHVIIGSPVYGGRLPVDAVKRFRQLKANKTLVTLVVVYGNREFEDALLELKTLSIELGFSPVAGGAFIGEHSFATKDVPIANGRPDINDLQIAMEFGAKIKDKITALKSYDTLEDFYISGRFPYAAGGARSMAVAPVTDENRCTICGDCINVCPTASISIIRNVVTKVEQCIRCCACIKNCPEDARSWEDSIMINIANGLSHFFNYPKEPRFFGVNEA